MGSLQPARSAPPPTDNAGVHWRRKARLTLPEQSFAPISAVSWLAGTGSFGDRRPARRNWDGGLGMYVVRLSAAARVAVSLTAWSGSGEPGTGPRENTGTLVGAVAGGLIGSQFGGGTG